VVAGSESKRAARAAKALTLGHRPLGWTLFGYIAREAVVPTLLALGGLSLAALTKSLLGLSDLLVNRGLSPEDTAAFVGFEIVVLAARILPFAVLLGALIALGRLAADKELLALESCGVSPGRLIGPVLAVGCLGTLGGLALSLQVVPATLAAYDHASGFGLVKLAAPLDARPIPLGDAAALGERQPALVISFGGEGAAQVVTVVSRRMFTGSWEYLLDSAIFTYPPIDHWSGAALIGKRIKNFPVEKVLVEEREKAEQRKAKLAAKKETAAAAAAT